MELSHYKNPFIWGGLTKNKQTLFSINAFWKIICIFGYPHKVIQGAWIPYDALTIIYKYPNVFGKRLKRNKNNKW